MHQAFYRKWRPQIFDDVCGQEHITSVLKYEAEHGAFSHAYLFCGSRGTGKTTCAKILAKAVNCLHPINGNPCGECEACRTIDSGAATDVLEMDAASNNGVDNIRDIRDEVVYAPSALKYRVYIIDEVHMLSVSAFNALLKTLEEPPEHVIFILATTELQKLPATIISRCQRFDFRRISTQALVDRLNFIAKEEKLTLHPDAARMIAKLAQGGMRDAISLLELCAGGHSDITPESVQMSVGMSGREAMLQTVEAIGKRNYDCLFSQIDEVVKSSKDLIVFWQDLISLYRDMLVMRSTSNAAAYLDLTDYETAQLSKVASSFSKETLLYHCKLLEEALFSMQKANAVKRIVAELTLVRMCDDAMDNSTEAILSRVAKLEDAVLLGSFQTTQPAVTATEKPEKSEEIKPKEEKKTEPQPKEAKTVPTSAIPEKRILRPLGCWMEAVERLAQVDISISSFCRSAKAYATEDGKIVVRFQNPFFKDMMEKNGGKERLRAALIAVMRKELPQENLVIEVVGNQEHSALDEIIDAIQE